MTTFLSLCWGTLVLRPYVFGFLLVFLVAGRRDLGVRRVLAFLGWGWLVAVVAELTSTRIGVPFGLYHYTGSTRGLELYIGNVPFFDSLSFPFLAYASLCLARRALGEGSRARVAFLAGVLMMLLDVVIDPLAVRGQRWFLGEIFYYPAGGVYFGVPLSNFAGWLAVGWVTVGGYLGAEGWRSSTRRPVGRAAGPGVALYYGVLAFNVIMTAWIGEYRLVAAGLLVHAALVLLLYGLSSVRLAAPERSGVEGLSRS
jgi:putative membrane protein